MSAIKVTNIILDMDGTILDYVPAGMDHNRSFFQIPIARSYLRLFMKYLFENFERVSIWTAASKVWYDQCYENVLKPALPEGKEFHFVKTRADYDWEKNVKPLRMVYEQFPDLYNEYNTIIIDDNAYTFAENFDQAIQIKSFYYDRLKKEVRLNLDKHDFELYNMIQILHARNNPGAPALLESSLMEEGEEPTNFVRWISSEEEEKDNDKEAQEIEALYNSVTSVEDW